MIQITSDDRTTERQRRLLELSMAWRVTKEKGKGWKGEGGTREGDKGGPWHCFSSFIKIFCSSVSTTRLGFGPAFAATPLMVQTVSPDSAAFGFANLISVKKKRTRLPPGSPHQLGSERES